jgi:hypothetical protein
VADRMLNVGGGVSGLARHPTSVMASASSVMPRFGLGVRPECFAAQQVAFLQSGGYGRSDQMRLRTLAVALAVAAPLLAVETTPAAAFGWCDWGWGYSGTSYTAPRSYGYYGYAAPRRYGYYGYAPRYYGGYYYGRRWGWRGYGYRAGWRGYGYRGWRGYGHRAGWRGYGYRGVRGYGYRAAWRGARVTGVRAGVRAGRRR